MPSSPALPAALPARIAARARRALVRAAALAPGDRGARARFVACRSALDDGADVPRALDVVAEMLARADAAHASGRGGDAIDWADKAIQLAFHPTVHYVRRPSPTGGADLPHLAPFRSSAVGRMLLIDPDPGPARETRTSPGRRVLVLCAGGTAFIERVARALGPDVEVRVVDPIRAVVAADGPAAAPTRRSVIAARYERSRTGALLPVPPALREDLDWADTVVLEWANLAFAWASLWEPTSARVVARLHRFESRTPYPALADMGAIDELVLVAGHMEALVQRSVPRSVQAGGTEVIGNLHDLTAFSTAKDATAERTLVQVGWDRPVKDVEATLDILEELRVRDPSWRLLLVGPSPVEGPGTGPFVHRVRSRLAALGDAVEALGVRDDVPDVLRRARYLVSSSRHEGTHEAVAEGAAAGCVPVVRDWPEAAVWGGAATVYPESWVVADADAAVARILGAAGGDAAAEGERAREQVLALRDPGRLVEQWRRALRGAGA